MPVQNAYHSIHSYRNGYEKQEILFIDMWADVSLFFFSSRRRHTRFSRDWSSDVCSSDLACPSTNTLDLRVMACSVSSTMFRRYPKPPEISFRRSSMGLN